MNMIIELAVSKLKEVFNKKGYKFFENGNYNLNIIGVRCENTIPNSFDDFLMCVYKVNNEWVCKDYTITTDAGLYWLENPMVSEKGCALLVPNQYRGVYKLDKHKGEYTALCQRNGKVDVYRDNDVSIAIWANHLLRANITTMQKITKTLMEDQNLLSIENNVASVSEVFRLQGAAELKEAEKRYLPEVKDDISVIILAASQGKELGELTLDKPKVMVPVRGKAILSHIVDTYNSINIKDLTVVRGFAKDAVSLSNINFVDNDDYNSTGELWSLKLALDAQKKQPECTIISYGDVLFHKYIVQMMQDADDDFVVMVDADWSQSRNLNRHADWVQCSHSNSRQNYGEHVTLRKVGDNMNQDDINGEWMGFLKVSKNGMGRVNSVISTIFDEDSTKDVKLPQLINQLIENGEKIRVLYTTGHWLDVDSLDDIVEAGAFNA